MRGLWRCHLIFAEALEGQVQGKYEYVAALLVQAQKCLLQVALDGGSWTNAHHLLPFADPVSAEEFGGTPVEMMAVHSFNKALTELKRQKSSRNKRSDDEPEQVAPPPGTAGRGAGRGRGRGRGQPPPPEEG